MPQRCEIVQVLAERTVATRFEPSGAGLVSGAPRLLPATPASLQPDRVLCVRARRMGDAFSTRKGTAMATNVEKTATAAAGEEKTFVCAVSTGS